MAKRIVQKSRETITPHERGADGITRNAQARVFLADGEVGRLVLKVGGEEILVARLNARSRAGKHCAFYIRTRAEKNVSLPEPVQPETP